MVSPPLLLSFHVAIVPSTTTPLLLIANPINAKGILKGLLGRPIPQFQLWSGSAITTCQSDTVQEPLIGLNEMTHQSKSYYAVGALGQMGRGEDGETETYQKIMKCPSWKQQQCVTERWMDRVEDV